MHFKSFALVFCMVYSACLFSQPIIELELYASGFNDPVDISNAGDDRLFIVEREGIIKIIDGTGTVLPTDFLNITDKIESGYNEQGLLGLAFHPDYSTNGFFYVNYIDNDENTVVARYSKSTFDENVADETTEYIIFEADQPYVNHNGGDLNFGLDGYLYIGLGDGGSAGDPGNRAQDPVEKLGKMHRIDVDGGSPYAIPFDNPFAGSADTLETIWSIGLRNPWRFSFDALTGDMWIGDVGQNLYEEVDFELLNDGGKNYGWRCYEADDEFNTSGCEDAAYYTSPIFKYFHSFATGGFAITGGYVYRGELYADLQGYYICADHVSGNWWTIKSDGAGGWISTIIEDFEADISTFGVDVNQEIYCADLYSGKIYHIKDACSNFILNENHINYECNTINGSIDLIITGGDSPISILWNTGDETEDLSDLLPGIYSVIVTDDLGCKKMDTIEILDIPAFEVSVSVSDLILTASLGSFYQWYLNGIEIPGATNQIYTVTENGNYSVIVSDANGCSVLSEEIEVTSVGIQDLITHTKVVISPNPVNEILTLNIESDMQLNQIQINIYNAIGEFILTEKIDKNVNGSCLINIQNLPKGNFILEVIGNSFSITESFVH